MENPNNRKKLDLVEEPVGMFAVFRRSGRSGARFTVAHDTYEKALEVARMHAAESIAQYGTDDDSIYYVLEFKAEVGIRGGKLVGA